MRRYNLTHPMSKRSGARIANAPELCRFLQATGLTHKTIRQIERAKHALVLLQQGVPILDVVYQAGYFDQPHLTRSLKHLLGQTPAQIIRMVRPA